MMMVLSENIGKEIHEAPQPTYIRWELKLEEGLVTPEYKNRTLRLWAPQRPGLET